MKCKCQDGYYESVDGLQCQPSCSSGLDPVVANHDTMKCECGENAVAAGNTCQCNDGFFSKNGACVSSDECVLGTVENGNCNCVVGALLNLYTG